VFIVSKTKIDEYIIFFSAVIG